MSASSRVPPRRWPLLTTAVVGLTLAGAIWLMAPHGQAAPAGVWISPPVPSVMTVPLAPPAYKVAFTPGGPPEQFFAGLMFESRQGGSTYVVSGVTLYPAPGVSDVARALLSDGSWSEGREIGEYATTGETTVVGGTTWQKWTLTEVR